MEFHARCEENFDYKKVLENAKRIVVLEDVENPTNIGAIFRSAAAFGIDAVLLSPACVDPFYRRAMRVSVGNALLVPWAYIGSSEARWKEEGIGWLKEEGFQTDAMVGTHPTPKAVISYNTSTEGSSSSQLYSFINQRTSSSSRLIGVVLLLYTFTVPSLK